ncbi:hypothetical protein Tco_0236831 [Tanacetum coccineum]
MDLMISLGQKNTLAEYMILYGADNRPPMLDKYLYDSWKSRMELYMQNREHGRMILESIEHGPLIWPTVEDNGVIRMKKYVELSTTEKIQAECDMKAKISFFKERERKLYDRFDKFTHIKGESLHTIPPEWSKFVTDVKLVKDLHTSNFDQLHAYIEQHEFHANEVNIMRERNQDPLAFVANQQMTPPHFNPYQSSYNNPPLQQQFSPSQYGSIQSDQLYSSHYSLQTQFNQSSIPQSHTLQSQMNHQTSIVPQVIPQVAYQSPQAHTQPMTESPFGDSGFAGSLFLLEMIQLVVSIKQLALSNGCASSCSEETRAKIFWYYFIKRIAIVQGDILQSGQAQSYPGISADQAQTIIPHNAAFQTEDLDTYDSNCDDLWTAQADFEQTPVMDFTDNEISSDSNIIPYSQYLQETQQATIQDTNFKIFLNKSKEKENKYMENEIDLEKKIKELDNIICYQNPFYLKKAQRIKPPLYDGVVLSNTHVAMPVIDDEETLILEEESR